jgi:UDPglucose 6-dehydrogenase
VAHKLALAFVITTEWQEFASLDLDRLGDMLRFPIVVDGRNLYKPQEMLDHGLTYVSIYRPASYLLQQSEPRKLVV